MVFFQNNFLLLTCFLLFSVPASIVDIREKRIPDSIVLCGAVLLTVLRVWGQGDPLIRVISEAAGGILLLFAIRCATHGKLGMGDVKFAGLMGIFIGFPSWFVATALASVLGLLIVYFGILCEIADKHTKIPFAPFLSAGSIGAYYIHLYFPGMI